MLIVEDEINGLSEEFNKHGMFTVTRQEDLFLISHLDVKAIVVDEKTIPFTIFLEKTSYLEDIDYLFYVLKESNEHIESICKTKGIIPIHSKTLEEIYEIVSTVIYPEDPQMRELYLFVGADDKAGTTTVVHSIANRLANLIDKKILVLSLSRKANDHIIEYSKSGLDNLRTSISSRVISFSEVLKETERISNYLFMAGPRDLAGVRKYSLQDIINLIEVLKNQQDYVVLIDGGNDIDNPLSIASLMRVKNVFMVMRNIHSHYQSLDQKINQVLAPNEQLQLNHKSFMYIVNQFDEANESLTRLHERNGVLAGTLPKSKYGDVAEENHTVLSNIDNEFCSEIDVLANLIAIKMGYSPQQSTGRNSLFKKLFARKGVVEYGV